MKAENCKQKNRNGSWSLQRWATDEQKFLETKEFFSIYDFDKAVTAGDVKLFKIKLNMQISFLLEGIENLKPEFAK